ncbi:MAG: hypothetical protein Q8O24_02170, partial [Gallionellaceae bacterium]|nr:hypothetical protein [Gallionellaceae bacterium]
LIVISLLASAYYLIFKSGGKDSFSWGSALLVLAYIVAIRWRIRFFLVKKWPYFKTHLSAPYFISSLFVLALCATLLVFNPGAVAEKLATIGYFLLVTGTLVEFMQFSKGGDGSVTNS